jgi:hypothetical protein
VGEYLPAIEYARAWIRLGDSEQVFYWLEKASSERNAFALLLNADPFYNDVREDDRFEHLRQLIGFVT